MNNKEIGKFLRQKRTEKQLTQAQLATEFGVTYQAVSRWETGESIPDIETLLMIADFYQIAVDDIFQRTAVKQTIDKWDDPSFTQPFYMKLLFAIFIFAHILGIGLGMAFASMSGTLWQILAILFFVIFVLGAQFSFNVYFFAVSDRTKEEIIWYQRTYRALIGLLLFTATLMNVLIVTQYWVYISLLFIFVLYCLFHIIFGVVEKYHDVSPSIFGYTKRKFFMIKSVLSVIILVGFLIIGLTGYRMVEMNNVLNIILIVLALL